MRISAVISGVVMLGVVCLAGVQSQDTCAVTLRLVDEQSGRELAGLVRVTDKDGRSVAVPELLRRGLGLKAELPINRWAVLPKATTVHLPRKALLIEAVSGLETEAANVTVDLRGKTTAELTIPLTRFYDASSRGFRSGNTHLHLQRISREEADRYLREVPQADDLDLLFVSYLERAVEDRSYISNRYSKADLQSLAKNSDVLFGNGEEHRHNFTGFGEGYGHVMFLNIRQLIQPVSIGPGIMKQGTDGIPLQRGIETARSDGAAVIWCHNAWGVESTPNFLTGRLDALNIFDGGTHGSYKDSFYRYLNAGLRVPFSTGTDWFMYDFSRVYVDMEGDVTVERWLDSLAAGKSYITNGPFLEFTVAGDGPGKTVRLDKPGTVPVEARALGRIDFRRIELVRDGQVVKYASTNRVGGHFEAKFTLPLRIDAPCWLALRTPPPPVPDDAELNTPVPRNELGRDLFAHSSPVYVTVAGQGVFDPTAADGLLAEMKAAQAMIVKNGVFADEQERARVLGVYIDGIAALQRRLKRLSR